MLSSVGTLETLARQLGLSLQPLKDRLDSGNVLDLFAELGLQFPTDLLKPSFTNALNSGVTAASALPSLITDLTNAITAGDEAGILQAGEKLIEQIGKLVSAFETISTEMKNLAEIAAGNGCRRSHRLRQQTARYVAQLCADLVPAPSAA